MIFSVALFCNSCHNLGLRLSKLKFREQVEQQEGNHVSLSGVVGMDNNNNSNKNVNGGGLGTNKKKNEEFHSFSYLKVNHGEIPWEKTEEV